MIESLIPLLGKFTELLKLNKKIKVERFEDIIKPIYEEMQKVHKDYLFVLESLKAMLDSHSTISEIAKKLMEDRLEQEAVRSSIISMVSSFREDYRNKQYLNFFEAVLHYFYRGDLGGRDTPSSILLHEMKEWINSERMAEFAPHHFDTSQSRKIIQQIISGTLDDLRSGWKDVSSVYAQLLTNK